MAIVLCIFIHQKPVVGCSVRSREKTYRAILWFVLQWQWTCHFYKINCVLLMFKCWCAVILYRVPRQNSFHIESYSPVRFVIKREKKACNWNMTKHWIDYKTYEMSNIYKIRPNDNDSAWIKANLVDCILATQIERKKLTQRVPLFWMNGFVVHQIRLLIRIIRVISISSEGKHSLTLNNWIDVEEW